MIALLAKLELKVWHVTFVQGVATVALFTGFLTGAEWIAASTIALGVQIGGEVAARKVANGTNP